MSFSRENRMRLTLIVLSALLSACGLADVGTSAATAAKLQAEQAKEGKVMIDQAKQAVDAAAKVQEQQLAEAEKKANN